VSAFEAVLLLNVSRWRHYYLWWPVGLPFGCAWPFWSIW